MTAPNGSPAAPAPAAAGGARGPAPEDLRVRDVRLANEYASASGVHARRALAARREGDNAKADEEQRIADRYWHRSQFKLMGFMPPELRTPTEGILRVDEWRRAIASLLASFADVTLAEWNAFEAAALEPDPQMPPPQVRLGDLRMILESWGIQWPPLSGTEAAPLPRDEPQFSKVRLPTDR